MPRHPCTAASRPQLQMMYKASGLHPRGMQWLLERKKERSTPVSRRALRGHSVNEDHRQWLLPDAREDVAAAAEVLAAAGPEPADAPSSPSVETALSRHTALWVQ